MKLCGGLRPKVSLTGIASCPLWVFGETGPLQGVTTLCVLVGGFIACCPGNIATKAYLGILLKVA